MRILFLSLLICSLGYTQKTRKIYSSYTNVKGRHSKMFQECVGAGRANEGLRADWQQQLKQVRDDCGFKYIRFHGLLHDDMGVYTEDGDGNAQYNWRYIDVLYDYLLEINMKPFVELSFTPSALKTNDKTVFWWKGNISPPKSYDTYYEFIRALTQHLEDRYGTKEVKSWYFEVWNEPNLEAFFSGTMDEYFKMYATAAKAIKDVNSSYKVGGPATAGGQWVTEMLAYCRANNQPLDFIATHTYGVKGFLDEFGKNQLIMKPNPHEMHEKVNRIRKEMNASSFADAELHFTEWSSSYSPTDNVHDTYQNASYVLNTLKNSEDAATSMSYWTFTDIFEEPGIPRGAFHGGFGLMNLHGIKKPTYLVYEYMNKLGPEELQTKDTDVWICKNKDGVQALFWDFTFLDQKGVHNREFYTQIIPSKIKSEVNFTIEDLPNGEYKVEKYRIGFESNDVFTAYAKMGRPVHLSKVQEAELKKMASGEPYDTEIVNVTNGVYKENFPLRENDVYFVQLKHL